MQIRQPFVHKSDKILSTNQTTICANQTTLPDKITNLEAFLQHLEIIVLISPKLLNSSRVQKESHERCSSLLQRLEPRNHLSSPLHHVYHQHKTHHQSNQATKTQTFNRHYYLEERLRCGIDSCGCPWRNQPCLSCSKARS